MTTLPHDLIGLILGFNDISYSVVTLWKCGNFRLNALMANSCTHVSLEDTAKWSVSKFPKMLRHLRRLRSLRINRGSAHHLMDSEELGMELQLLSPTLETLELICFEAETCLYSTALNDLGSFFALEIDATAPVELKTSRKETTARTPMLWEIASKFPRLTKLTLSSSRPSLSNLDLLEFPSTLTSLAITAPSPLQGDEILAAVPRNLTSLYIRGGQWREEFVRQLPQGLTELTMRNQRSRLDETFFSALPRSLTLLQSTMALHVPRAPKAILQLPPGIRILKFAVPTEIVNTVDAKTLCLALPRQLTTLHFHPNDRKLLKQHLELETLPKTLTELKVPGLSWIVNENQDFPPLLAYFIISEVDSWKTEHWKKLERCERMRSMDINAFRRERFPNELLPRNLTYLRINARSHIHATAEHLPVGLVTLRMFCLQYDPAQIPLLPRRLTELSISFTRYPTIEESDQWPPQLRELNYALFERRHTQYPEARISAFRIPSGVIDFQCTGMSETHLLKEDFMELPRGLRSARLESSHCGDVSSATIAFDAFSGLPPRLRSLDCGLEVAKTADIDAAEYLKFLPGEKLKKLMLCTPTLYDRHLLLIPRCVYNLCLMSYEGNKLTEQGIANLPVGLGEARIQNDSPVKLEYAIRSHILTNWTT